MLVARRLRKLLSLRVDKKRWLLKNYVNLVNNSMDKKSILKNMVSGAKAVGNTVSSALDSARKKLSRNVVVSTMAPIVKSITPPGAKAFLNRATSPTPPGADKFLTWSNLNAKNRSKQRDIRMD